MVLELNAPVAHRTMAGARRSPNAACRAVPYKHGSVLVGPRNCNLHCVLARGVFRKVDGPWHDLPLGQWLSFPGVAVHLQEKGDKRHANLLLGLLSPLL